MKRNLILLLIALHLIGFITGCSDDAVPIDGGTAGKLTSDGKAMSQMELTFYSDSPFSGSPVAYGAVQNDGAFELVDAPRTEAIELEPGDYRVTVESLGADVEIPKQYSDPSKTTLRLKHIPPEPVVIEIPGLSKGM